MTATAHRPCARPRFARPSRKPSTIDFREVIEPKPVIRALAVAAGVLCVGAALAPGRAGTVADRHDDGCLFRLDRPTGRVRRIWSLTRARPPSRSLAAIRSRCRSRSVPATRCRTPRRRLTISPTAKRPVSRSVPSRGASSGDGSIRSISRSSSRSPPATIPRRSAMSPSRSFLLRP